VAIFATGCGSHSGASFPADAGGDHAIVDGSAEASGGDDGGTSSDAAGPDAAELAECSEFVTCALPWTCDETDLLCEPVCNATQTCGAGTYCRLTSPGALSGSCVGPDYQCLGNVPAPPAPTASFFTITDTFMDVSSGTAVPAVGLTVKVCEKSDTACAAPDNVGMTDTSGSSSLSVPAGTDGFDGYLDVTGPSGDGGTIVETLLFANQPVLANVVSPTTDVSTAPALEQELAALGTLDPTRAQLTVVDGACRATPAFGASLTVSSADGATKVGYVGPSGIVPAATTFPVSQSALAYVLNVPGTTTTLTTTYGGQTVNDLAVVLRPGVLVVVSLAASPVPSM
jgi:hypothetical protein